MGAHRKSQTPTKGAVFPPLLDATLDDLAGGLERGVFTSEDLVNAYVARIQEVNPALKAVSQLNPDALSIAAELDALRAQGNIRGPLHGIPILLKDNIATADKMDNTGGSFAFVGAKVSEDSTVAARLRSAGAIILGKTTLDEMAGFRADNKSSGWSSVGGQTMGAYCPNQIPGGSSSGSGVAVSVGLGFASVGTDTAGSVIFPSERGNIVGIRPTRGLVSQHLVIPLIPEMDTPGPMARTVKDAAHLLSAIAGRGPEDSSSTPSPFDRAPDYASACKLSGLAGKRIGVPRHTIPDDGLEVYKPVLAALDAALDVMRAAGAEIVDDIYLQGYDEWDPLDNGALNASFVHHLPKYTSQLAINPNKINSVEDLIRFTKADHRSGWPACDVFRWEDALKEAKRDPLDLDAARERLTYQWGEMGITGALERHGLDALVAPSDFDMTMPALIGTPVITVPLGAFPEGMNPIPLGPAGMYIAAPNVPFGIAFMGARWSEEALIGMAYAFEQKTGVRGQVKPYLVPKTEIGDVRGKGKAGRARRDKLFWQVCSEYANAVGIKRQMRRCCAACLPG